MSAAVSLLRNSGLFGSRVRRILGLAHRAERARTHGELMGVEGAAANVYFELFASLLPPEFSFSKRTRRPPADPANSLLSFAYSLLHHNVHSASVLEGLDPRLGLLHTSHSDFSALASDLMEEFRAPLADAFVLAFISSGRVRTDQFQKTERGCWMNAPLRRQFLQSFETVLWGQVPGSGRNWREQMQWQARCLADWLLGRRKQYVPFRWSPKFPAGQRETPCS